MTCSITRKAMTAVAAILATGTVAMAQGPIRRIPADRTHTHTAFVYQGVTTQVVIRGDRIGDVSCFVYNRFGLLVAADDDSTEGCVVRWIPTATEMVTIRVVSAGVSADYVIEILGGRLTDDDWRRRGAQERPLLE